MAVSSGFGSEEDLVYYGPGEPFAGEIGRALDQSSPAWPAARRPPADAPNIAIFILDDVGFGQLSPFGGLCETPTLDRLAAGGLRYTNFQTTALCSPTRGCLLTGRNHHTLGLGAITELGLGYPAHNALMGFEHGFLSEMLVEHGYNTFAIGKWHLTAPEETTPAGPFHRWPLGRGFERYYGFLAGDTNQWYPDLVHDNHYVSPPATPEQGYHLNADLGDKAIDFIQDAHVNAPDKPFFLYFATGAGHAPHHVEREWIERYAGAFDMGWDEYRHQVHRRQLELGIVPPGSELSERDPDVAAWDTLSPDERRIYARQMETYAGFLSQTDHHIGRVVDFIDRIGELDNTLIVALSDNGASAEGQIHGTRNEMFIFNRVPDHLETDEAIIEGWGGPDTFPHYSWGWAWAGDTPFRRWKRETYRGGITDPCVVHWPDGISAHNETRDQYLHAIDVVPTVLELLGIDAPAEIRGVGQSEIQGVSFAQTFDDASTPTRHHKQYFEMLGHRSIYEDGWKAVCPWPGPSLAEGQAAGRVFMLSELTTEILDELDESGWELYHVAEDPAECHNLAATHRDRLEAMIRSWWTEAERNGVLPVAGGHFSRFFTPRPSVSGPRNRFVFYPGGAQVPFTAAPRLNNRAHSIDAVVTVPEGGCEGVLLAHGSRFGGYVLYVKDGYLHYAYNYVGLERFELASTEPMPPGAPTLRFEFETNGFAEPFAGKGAPGIGRLFFDDRHVGTIELPHTVPIIFGIGGLTCGYDGGDPVNPGDYEAPFRFTGEIESVTVDLSGELSFDTDAELDRARLQQ